MILFALAPTATSVGAASSSRASVKPFHAISHTSKAAPKYTRNAKASHPTATGKLAKSTGLKTIKGTAQTKAGVKSGVKPRASSSAQRASSATRATSATTSTTTQRLSASSANDPLLQANGFEGVSQDTNSGNFCTNQNLAPPDAAIAVGPNDIGEVTNSTVSFFYRNGSVDNMYDLSLSASSGCGGFITPDIPSGFAVSDPRLIYDAPSGRWVFSELEYNPFFTCSNSVTQSYIALMISNDSDPTDGWYGVQLPTQSTDGSGNYGFGDQPALGISDNVIAASSNVFDCNGFFLGNELNIVQKSDMISNVNPGVATFEGGPFGAQPAQSLSATPTQYVVANLSPYGPNNNGIGVYAFSGTPDNFDVTSDYFTEPMAGTHVDASNGLIAPAQQKGTSKTLATNDDRFLNAVWQNGELAVADNTQCTPAGDGTPRSCLNFVSVNASSNGDVTGSAQLANVGVKGGSLFFPAISFDGSGNLVTTFNESSVSTFESIQVASLTPAGAPGAVTGWAMSPLSTLHASTTFYDSTGNGIPCSFGANGLFTGSCRWGDYSGAAQDPGHPGHVWVGAEDVNSNDQYDNCATNGCWASYIGDYTLASPSAAFSGRNSPAAATDNWWDRVFSFWKGVDGNLWMASSSNGTTNPFVGPTKLGFGPLGSIPTAVVRGYSGTSTDKEVDVFWAGADGNLWMAAGTGFTGNSVPATWTLSKLGFGPLGSAPSADTLAVCCASPQSTQVNVFWEGTDRNLWEATEAAGASTFTGPIGIGDGPLGSPPSAAAAFFNDSEQEQDVFWKGTDSGLWYSVLCCDGAPSGPIPAKVGTLAGAPSANVNQPDTYDIYFNSLLYQYNVFWVGGDGGLRTARLLGENDDCQPSCDWHGPYFLGMGPLGSAPAATGDGFDLSNVFWQGQDRNLWYEYDFAEGDGVHGPFTAGMGPLG
jgi:hypothetical protein